MPRRTTSISVFVLLLILLIPKPLSAGPATAPYVKGELLVAFQEPPGSEAKDPGLIYGSRQTLRGLQAKGMLKDKGANLLLSAGATGLKAVLRQQASNLKPGRSPRDWQQVYRVRFRKNSPVFKSRASMRKFCETLSAEPGIEYAEPNYVGSLTAMPNDPIYPYQQQATFTQYGLEAAWDVETGSPELIIALIDSGMDLDHPDLIANLAVNPGELADNALDDDGNRYVDDVYGWNFVGENGHVEDELDHGTRVAGIIAARGNNAQGIAGVCWQAKLLPIKVSSATGGITVDRVAAAIRYAVARGAKVINLSLVFSGESKTLQAACNGAAKSAVVVGAAGNNGQNFVPLYPAGFEGVIGVAALDATGERAAFSNYNNPGINEWVDFAAPGTDVFTTYPLGLYDGDEGRGTSFAAPFVSGIAALLKAANPLQSPAAIWNHLQRTADRSIDFTTYGIIDADNALNTVMEPDLRIACVRVVEATPSDEDQALDPGETAKVYIELENLGADMLVTKDATLSSASSEITVAAPTSVSTLPALKSGESSRQYLAAYQVEAVSPTSQVDVPMELDVDGIDTLSFELRIEEEAFVPLLIASDMILGPTLTWIVSDVTSVTNTATLTAQPGTTVKFEENARLDVFGGLFSIGTKENPIRWLNRTPSPRSLFATSFEIPVGVQPTGVALGDVTGDGIPDIVTANSGSGDVSVLAGDGAGGFFPQARYAVGNQPSSVALGDVDGDGVTDIVTANSGIFGAGNDVSVLTGDGTGGFSPQVRYAVGYGPSGVALGDIDGDGVTDIVTANGSSGDVSVLLGDGSGGVLPQARYAVGNAPSSVALGDVDGDGVTDIVTTNGGTDDVSVLSGNGSGGFLLQARYAVGNWPESVALGDVDKDGAPDIVTANNNSHDVSVLLGDGAGGFLSRVRYPVGNNPMSVALGDVNGDGIMDIVTANSGEDDVSVLLGDGAGGFLPQVRYPVSCGPGSIALGDVNGDGTTDVVTANTGRPDCGDHNDASVLSGDGAGGFLPQVRYAVGDAPLSVALGDLNGDGDTDIVATNGGADDVSVLSRDGAGGFLPQVWYAVGNQPSSVALGDLNGDGIMDIVTANYGDDDVSVLLGDGAGGFLNQARYAVGNWPLCVALGDVDGDGVPDILTANSGCFGGGDDVSVLSGNGSGGFLPQVRYGVGDDPRSMAIGDVDGDEVPDIVTANYMDDDVSVLSGDGAGGLLPQVRYAVGNQPSSVALGDVNGDEVPDIVIANSNSNDVSVLLGDGAGGFLPEVRYAVGNNPMSVALGDLNGDRVMDVVTANAWDDNVSVLLGDGAGGFLLQAHYAVGNWPESVALGDVDKDGVPDVVTANSMDDDVSVLSGDGVGSFRNGKPSLVCHRNQITLDHSVFQLRLGTVLLDGGNITSCMFKDSGAPGLSAKGSLFIRDCTAENCLDFGFFLPRINSPVQGLASIDNRGSGISTNNASDCAARRNNGVGIIANATVDNCLADLNEEQGLFSFGTVKESISTRSSSHGIQARVVQNSLAGSNAGTGIIASERITGCTAISNGQGVEAPIVEDTFVLDSYGDGLVGVTDALRVELQENYWISSDEVRFATSILANNAGDVDLGAVVDMYIAGNEGGGVDAGWTIPISNSTIIGNKGDGVINNDLIMSSNIAFNQGYGVIGGTVDSCFLKGNQSGPTSGATVMDAQSAPVQAAKAFLLDVTPDEQTSLSVGFHTFLFTFSKPMRTSSLPLITHGPEAPYDYRVFQSEKWLSDTVLRARTYIDYNTPDGFHTIRLAGAVSQDGFRIPPDTYHRFEVDIEGGLVINAAVAENTLEGILIKWTSDATNVARYEIYRSEDGGATWGDEPYITLFDPSARSYLDAWVVTGRTYWYRVEEVYTTASGGGHDEKISRPEQFTYSAPSPPIADLNHDGQVGHGDFIEMMRQGRYQVAPSPGFDNADLNENGRVDQYDYFLFQQGWKP